MDDLSITGVARGLAASGIGKFDVAKSAPLKSWLMTSSSVDHSASSVDHSASDSMGVWLRRLSWLAAIALLACCCWLVWRISMVVYQMESAVVAISDDVKQMSSTGVQISDHLQQLDKRLQVIEQKAADAMNLDEFEHLLDEVDKIRDAAPKAATATSAESERAIKHLLAHIRRSNHRFTYSDENKGGMRFYLQLYAKYKAYDKVIASAEDFIDKVGTKTIAGHPYQVVISPDETVALSDWLTDELKKHRELGNQPTREE